jgi:histidyl-tRNA synthetase
VLNALRQADVRATLAFGDRSFKAQFRHADRENARYALVIGDDELERGEISLQDMQTDAPREAVRLDQVVEIVRQRLAID